LKVRYLSHPLHNAWIFEREKERRSLDAYARGYNKYRQRQRERKHRKR
jgi:hypothetical protein